MPLRLATGVTSILPSLVKYMMLKWPNKKRSSRPAQNFKRHGKPRMLPMLRKQQKPSQKQKVLILILTTLSISQLGLESSRLKVTRNPQLTVVPKLMVVTPLHSLLLPHLKKARLLALEKKLSLIVSEMKVKSACKAKSPLLLTNAELPSLLVSVDSVLSRWLS